MQVLTSSLTQTQLTPNYDALAFMRSTKKATLHYLYIKKITWFFFFFFVSRLEISVEKSL